MDWVLCGPLCWGVSKALASTTTTTTTTAAATTTTTTTTSINTTTGLGWVELGWIGSSWDGLPLRLRQLCWVGNGLGCVQLGWVPLEMGGELCWVGDVGGDVLMFCHAVLGWNRVSLID